MRELLDKVTAWLVIAALAIGAAFFAWAGWQGRGWWNKRHRPATSITTTVKPETAPVAPDKPLDQARGKYVPPELGVDVGALRAEIAAGQERERAWTLAWINDCRDSLIGKPPLPIRDTTLYKAWFARFLQVYGEPPDVPPPEQPPTPEQVVNNAIKQFGLGLWPGLVVAGIEYEPWRPAEAKRPKLNYTMLASLDVLVAKRWRLGGVANLYEGGPDLGFHLVSNTYARAWTCWRYDGGRPGPAPDAVGLGVGTQF